MDTVSPEYISVAHQTTAMTPEMDLWIMKKLKIKI
jgi:hypothetical protein